jgi:alanine racemase
MERASAQIDLNKIVQNLRTVKKVVGPKTKVMAVVKSDAYGHGLLPVASIINKEVDYFGVAWLEEAVKLREEGIKTPIFLLTEPMFSDQADKIVKLELTPTIYTFDFASVLSKQAVKLGKKQKAHLKIDTGMGRLGIPLNEAVDLIESVSRLENLKIEGVFTHFSQADDKKSSHTNVQLKKFNEIVFALENRGIRIPIKHAANSAAVFNFPHTHLDMVRVGISLYKGALSFRAKVSHLKAIPKNSFLSYGTTYKTKTNTKIAVISCGYADGVDRGLSNSGEVLIHGKRYPIVGNVCMDMCLVDLGNSNRINVGDEVVFLGKSKNEEITIDEVAKKTNTISYEVMCRMGSRIQRKFLQ